ncbi:MAG: hypothetical protein H8D56_25445 [Planctomycetes bacterium]|nr:hypothetical protein [Planctomycetota bacterium]
MIDCSKEIAKFHEEDVRLTAAQRQQMRDHRNANQKRLRKGLKDNEKPLPDRNIKQGSYAMHTMVQHPDNDYDIDDGAVFIRDDLKGERDGDMSPREARDMVRDALDDGSFATPPETKKNCVRVLYQAGYHVDVPVYREHENDSGEMVLELASSEWRESDPQLITNWFNDAVITKSPDESNGRQLRRIVCLLKQFARSRKGWKLPSGLILSVLADEKYWVCNGRDDLALYQTMLAIRDRLNLTTNVYNPVDSSEELSKGSDDPKVEELLDRLDWAIDRLRDVFNETCSKNEALKRWNDIFKTDFFSQFLEKENGKGNGLGALVGSMAANSPKQWAME